MGLLYCLLILSGFSQCSGILSSFHASSQIFHSYCIPVSSMCYNISGSTPSCSLALARLFLSQRYLLLPFLWLSLGAHFFHVFSINFYHLMFLKFELSPAFKMSFLPILIWPSGTFIAFDFFFVLLPFSLF